MWKLRRLWRHNGLIEGTTIKSNFSFAILQNRLIYLWEKPHFFPWPFYFNKENSVLANLMLIVQVMQKKKKKEFRFQEIYCSTSLFPPTTWSFLPPCILIALWKMHLGLWARLLNAQSCQTILHFLLKTNVVEDPLKNVSCWKRRGSSGSKRSWRPFFVATLAQDFGSMEALLAHEHSVKQRMVIIKLGGNLTKEPLDKWCLEDHQGFSWFYTMTTTKFFEVKKEAKNRLFPSW